MPNVMKLEFVKKSSLKRKVISNAEQSSKKKKVEAKCSKDNVEYEIEEILNVRPSKYGRPRKDG